MMTSTNNILIEVGGARIIQDFTNHPNVIRRQQNIEQRRQIIENIYESFQSYYRNLRNFHFDISCFRNIIAKISSCNILYNDLKILYSISIMLLFINEIKIYNIYWKRNYLFGILDNNITNDSKDQLLGTPYSDYDDDIKRMIFENSIPQCFSHTLVNHYTEYPFNNNHNPFDIGIPIVLSVISTIGSFIIMIRPLYEKFLDICVGFIESDDDEFSINTILYNVFYILFLDSIYHIPMAVTLSSILRITKTYNAFLFWYSQLWIAIIWISIKLLTPIALVIGIIFSVKKLCFKK